MLRDSSTKLRGTLYASAVLLWLWACCPRLRAVLRFRVLGFRDIGPTDPTSAFNGAPKLVGDRPKHTTRRYLDPLGEAMREISYSFGAGLAWICVPNISKQEQRCRKQMLCQYPSTPSEFTNISSGIFPLT